MRGRKAKALRKIIKTVSAHLPEREILWQKNHCRKIINGEVVEMLTAVNSPNSQRGQYRELKRRI